ncbi:SAM-dependent methyltransferase [bacterium]|nr:SAM-dependent methyltransferase [bacterium]
MITFSPIAQVSNDRKDLRDDDWGGVVSRIILNEDYEADLIKGLADFSHVEVVFYFDQLSEGHELPVTRHPRNNPEWPDIGLLAQRSVYHPNAIGLTTAQVIGVEGNTLIVQGLDAVNGTPVLDIKPVFLQFLPQNVEQPGWVSELMKDYWSKT